MVGFQKPTEVYKAAFTECVRGGVIGGLQGALWSVMPLLGGKDGWQTAAATGAVAAVVRHLAENAFPQVTAPAGKGWKNRTVKVLKCVSLELSIGVIATVGLYLILGRPLILIDVTSTMLRNNGLQVLFAAVKGLRD